MKGKAMININKFKITERMECSADTKLFFDDVYKSGTRGKKQQVDVLQYGRSLLSKCAGYTQYFLSDVYTNSTRTKKAQVETAQCGRSMIEMLGVLAIVGVLSVGGIAGYSKAMTKFKINKTIDQVSHIVANIRTLYAQQTTYSGLTTEQAIKMGVIPDSLATSNNDPYITNTFNGSVFITEDFYSSTSAFLLHFSGLPKEACIALATSDWGSKNTTGLTAISIGDNYNTGPWNAYAGNCSMDIGGWDNVACPGDSNNPTPVNVTTAASICSQCSNNCSISWRFE